MTMEMRHTKNSQSLWTVDRLAEYLDVPIPTIRDWCYKRTIPFIKVGRLVRFKPKDIETWLETNHVPEHRW